jgi:hypothetical protein
MEVNMLVAGFFDQGFFRGLLMLGIAFCWGFALYDLVRRPMKGWHKAIWFVVILALPILGAAIYILTSPTAGIEAPVGMQDVTVDERGFVRDPRAQIPHGGV